MRLGLLADIHEHIGYLRSALDLFRQQKVDRILVLGDVLGMGTELEETCSLLQKVGAIGVWGNHEFGLSCDPDEEARERYAGPIMTFMSSLSPRLEIDGCLFTHVEPWLDPTVLEEIWHVGDRPDMPENRARSFRAFPHRVMVIGHHHLWQIVTPNGPLDWQGDKPIRLDRNTRYLIVIAALYDGRYALFDTEALELVPFNERALPVVDG
jgi:hypothetical protein